MRYQTREAVLSNSILYRARASTFLLLLKMSLFGYEQFDDKITVGIFVLSSSLKFGNCSLCNPLFQHINYYRRKWS